MANEIYDSTWWGNTIQTASSIGTSTEMIQGQFNLTKIGDELVVNGDFSNGLTNWISEGAPLTDGGVRMESNGATGSFIKQGNVLVSGNDYKLTFEIKSITVQGSLRVGFSNLGSVNITDIGVYTLYFTANTVEFQLVRNSAINVVLDNVSVKEVRATTVEASKCLADSIHRIGIQDIQN